jgi:hypothetical protein
LGTFEVEHHTGRLVETRVSALTSIEDVVAFGARFREVAGAIAAEQVIICGDYRKTHILAPAVAEKFVAMLTSSNPRVERSGILCSPDHATALLQIERTVKEANNKSRRTFRDPAELGAWLAEVLTPNERERVAAFFAQ